MLSQIDKCKAQEISTHELMNRKFGNYCSTVKYFFCQVIPAEANLTNVWNVYFIK